MEISVEAIGPWKTKEKEKTQRDTKDRGKGGYRVGNDREKKSVWKLNTAG